MTVHTDAHFRWRHAQQVAKQTGVVDEEFGRMMAVRDLFEQMARRRPMSRAELADAWRRSANEPSPVVDRSRRGGQPRTVVSLTDHYMLGRPRLR